jgi:hypothetical protein
MAVDLGRDLGDKDGATAHFIGKLLVPAGGF